MVKILTLNPNKNTNPTFGIPKLSLIYQFRLDQLFIFVIVQHDYL